MLGTVIFSAAIGMNFFLLGHFCIWRLFPADSPRIVLISEIGAAGMLISSAACWFLPQGNQSAAVISVLWLDIFFLIFYLFIYAGIARSVSVTILIGLLEKEKGTLKLDKLIDEYAVSPRFKDRVALMEKSGLVKTSGDGIQITKKGFYLAGGARCLACLIGGGLEG
ncbi:MAG: hypothetical protein HY747_04025 [Elusimicrobia bacterium]|nr:hypothetical protein [Elusimicrobiota bacterium]